MADLPAILRRGRQEDIRRQWPSCERRYRIAAAIFVSLLAACALSGCGQFFSKAYDTTGTTGTGTTTTGDYLYVADYNSSLNTVAGFSLSSGALTATASSPYLLGQSQTPQALALTPDNSLLFVATSLGGVYVYTVASDGALTLGNGGSAVAGVIAQSLVVDPTGKWLLALQNQASGAAPILSVFAIDTSTGTLTTQGTALALDPGTATQPSAAGQLLIVPSSTTTNFMYAALGEGGFDVLTFDTTAGSASKLSLHYNPLGSAYSDNRLATDPTGSFLYVAETGANGVRSFTINTDASLTELASSPTAQGTGGSALLVDSTGQFLYSADTATNTLSAFSIGSTGALTALSTPSYTTGTAPTDIVEDNTGGYLAVVCSGGTPDLDLYPITASGALGTVVTASTGTSSPAIAYAIVASH